MNIKLDKTHFSVVHLKEASNDKNYWLSKTHRERLEALEFLRQKVFGYDPITSRLQRVFEVTEFPQS